MVVGAIEAQGQGAKVGFRRRVKIDSGAGVSVWPNRFGEDRRASPNKSRATLEAANGAETQQYGSPKVPFRARGSTAGGMELLFRDVAKPLAAVSAIVDAGNEVVFAKQGSFIRNIRTGERIFLKREGGLHHGCDFGCGGGGGVRL